MKQKQSKRGASRIFAGAMAAFMVLSAVDVSGWGVLTAKAEETTEITLAENPPQTLTVTDDTGEKEIIKDGELQDDGVADSNATIYQGTNWHYDSTKNQLVLKDATIRYITGVNGDLTILLSGENTLSGFLKFGSSNGDGTLEINGENNNGSLDVAWDITSTMNEKNVDINITGAKVKAREITCKELMIKNSDVNVDSSSEPIYADGAVIVTNSYVEAVSGYPDVIWSKSISVSDSQIVAESTEEDVYIEFPEENISNSVIIKKCQGHNTETYVYGTATLKKDLTIASGESIEFASGASITNLEKLALEDGASLLVDGVEHTHNTDGDITYTWEDDKAHIKGVACKDCPIGYVTTETESHSIGENGFCACNNAYQSADLTTDKYDMDGDGSKDAVYEISNAGQLYWFAGLVNGTLSGVEQNKSANAVLTADIVVNKNVLKSDGTLNDGTFKEWAPIGTSASPYTGIFEGQNHTISGLYFYQENKDYVGLFGSNSGKISNVGVLDSYFYGGIEVGGVSGRNYKGTITNCNNTGSVSGGDCVGGVSGYNNGTITNCNNTGSVSGGSDVGGVSGFDSEGIITNCNNIGSVSGGNDVGGVSGYGNKGTITNCNNTGSVRGRDCVGGVNGYEYNEGTITNCNNTGSVSGNEAVGGVSGYDNCQVTITNCNNAGSVSGANYVGGVSGDNANNITITNCNNTGSVSGANYVGGVSGDNDPNGTITNCYYDSTIYTGSAIGENNGTTEKVEGKTTEQYKTGEVAYLLQLDQSEEAWGQTIGTDTYPTLGGTKVYKNPVYKGCEGNPGDVASYEYSNTEKNIYGEHPDADNDGKCDVCDAIIDGIGAKLAGYSLSLTGNIGVNFYMELSDDVVNDESAYMNFTLPNGTTSKVYVNGTHEDGSTAATDTTVKNGVTYYVFTCEVAPKEMTSDIQAQMIGNNGEKKGTVHTYTVKEYADYILSHMSADGSDISKATIQLVKGMLNYGGAAQKYFGYKTDKLASDGLDLTERVFNDTSIINLITNDANKASVTYYNAQDKVTFKSAYLSLNSTTDLCVYVQFADDVTVKEDMFAIWCNTDKISEDQYEVTKVNEENCYKITLHGMKASQLNEKYAFCVQLSDTEYVELAYGTNSYAYTVMSSACDNINNIESLREVVKALYAYGSCAQEYEYYKNEGSY